MKLKDIGVDGCYLSWVRDYLSDRKQFLAYGGVCSNLTDVLSGVVQDSCIGPLPFSSTTCAKSYDMPDHRSLPTTLRCLVTLALQNTKR